VKIDFVSTVLLFIYSLPFSALHAQELPIQIEAGETIQVSLDGADIPHFEPHLAVNPTDPDNMIAASMALPEAGQGHTVRVYTSFDGGRTWSYQALDTTPVYGGDPWLTFGPDGTAFFLHLPGIVRRSTDGGRTWSPPVHLPRGAARAERKAGAFDYPKMLTDQTAGPYSGRLYVVASQADRLPSEAPVYPIALLRSLDGGKSFSFPVHLLPGNINYHIGAPVILADGTLLIPFQEITKRRGVFFDSPRLWMVRSEDGGKSFSIPFLMRENFQATSPHMAVDTTGGDFNNHVYAAWSTTDAYDFNLFLSVSVDRGENWSGPVRINDEIAHDYTQRPAVAVSEAGMVGLLWIDTRADSSARCFTPYFAISDDGGATIEKNTALSDGPICNDTPANKIPFSESGTTVYERWSRGGDYFGLAPLPDGSFQALWADSRTGVFQLWTTRIKVQVR